MTAPKKIFISHRTTDKPVADMLLDFLATTGVPRDSIKCSSLPGNDVKEKISPEVRDWIQRSVINIAILSYDYYKSAYCLNEAGILWYLNNTPVIPVALPEIGHEEMIGFLDGEYKLRRLDSDDDIAYVYDAVQEAMSVPAAKHSVINTETKKLKERYRQFCENRAVKVSMTVESEDDDNEHWLDEEDLYIDGYHEVHDRDGNVIEKGQYIKGKLVDGISYNIILKIAKNKGIEVEPEPTEEAEDFDGYDYDCWRIRNTEDPVEPESIDIEGWNYSDFGRYDVPFVWLRSNRYITGIGLEYFYVVDKKVRLDGKMVKPTFTNFRTLESVMAEKDPDELEYLKTGIRKYDETDSAEVEI